MSARAATLLCLSLVLTGCPKPGEGEKAERGFQFCQPIIAALDRYHSNAGTYPEDLDALTPTYLATVPRTVNEYPIEYERSGASYRLRFTYERPGMNHCDYRPETGWTCSGYF